MTKKSGLGRGLGALLGDPSLDLQAADEQSPMRELPVDRIVPNPNQPRKIFDENDLDELAGSIATHGLLQPIVVRETGHTYQIVAGERRYTAARRAGLRTIPVIVRDVGEDEVLQLALIENLQRSDLNPLEAARGYRSLVEENGMTHEEVAHVLSKSRSSITNALRLLDLPDKVQTYVEEGQISAGHARAILSAQGEEARIALAQRVIREGLSVRQTETLGPLISVNVNRKRPQAEPAPKSYGLAAHKLRNALGTKVRVRTVRGKNKVEIEFGSEEELESLVARVIGD